MAAQAQMATVLICSPDRLSRNHAYQALLAEERATGASMPILTGFWELRVAATRFASRPFLPPRIRFMVERGARIVALPLIQSRF